MRIWFLTRSLYPYQKTGGGQIRLGQIEYLTNLGWNIEVIMPNYKNSDVIKDKNITQIPFSGNLRIASLLEKIGLKEDYLDEWVKAAFTYLKDKLNATDIIFATSGGELGPIKLASMLKKVAGNMFVINFHDPLDYSLVNNLKLDKKIHLSREKQEKKYLSNADLVITSSVTNQYSLHNKYPEWRRKIVNNYFGYINPSNIQQYNKKSAKKLRIAYVGSMSPTQKPEILYKAFKKLCDNESVEIFFIGDTKHYTPLQNISEPNIHFINFMPHEEFLKYMSENIDIGFVCLANEYLGACVPSKIYEYINLGLPMIGALPDGDGMDIINSKEYGISCSYNDPKSIAIAIEKFQDRNFLEKIRNNILRDRALWDMKSQISEVDTWLRQLTDVS